MEQLARCLLAKLRFFGIDGCLLDQISDDLAAVCLVAKTGLTIIESASSPAESYYLEHVSFPGFVRRYRLERYLPAGEDLFLQSAKFVSLRFPQFYHNCITWPASTL